MVFYVLGITEQARKHTSKKQNQKGIVCNDFDLSPSYTSTLQCVVCDCLAKFSNILFLLLYAIMLFLPYLILCFLPVIKNKTTDIHLNCIKIYMQGFNKN